MEIILASMLMMNAEAYETKWTCGIYGGGQVFCLQQGQEVVWEVSPMFFIPNETRVMV